MNKLRYSIILLFLLSVLSTAVMAQAYNPFNQRDDKYRLLGLKRAKEIFETTRSDYDRQQQLYDKKLITLLELERSRSTFADAEVNYQQSLLAVIFEEQYISVDKAIKYHDENGVKHVRLTLVNTSGGSTEFQHLLDVDDALFRTLQPGVIHNVYVSILNEEEAIVSQPYESKIDRLLYGEPQTLDFTLLQNLDAVMVRLIYGNGSRRDMKIFLQKDNTVNKVAVQSEQFSQEVELGSKASFDLALELFSGVNNTFHLEVVNLPLQISRFFKTPAGDVRLSQLKFTETTRTKRAALEVSLPDRPTAAVVMDLPIAFYVLLIPHDRIDEFGDLQNKIWTEEELKKLDIGFVRLEIVPRGIGKLLVRSPQLYHSIMAEEAVDMNIEIFNEGNHRLDNVEIKVELPLNWTRKVTPQLIPTLDIGQDQRVNLVFSPPDDIAVGKYEVRIRTSAMSNSQPVTNADKIVTVEIRAETNVLGIVLIIFLVLGLVSAIVIYGIKLSRR